MGRKPAIYYLLLDRKEYDVCKKAIMDYGKYTLEAKGKNVPNILLLHNFIKTSRVKKIKVYDENGKYVGKREMTVVPLEKFPKDLTQASVMWLRDLQQDKAEWLYMNSIAYKIQETTSEKPRIVERDISR